MATKEPKIPDVVISIDLGGSLSKVSALTKDGKYCLLALLSEVSAIPGDILKDVQASHWGEASPESRIWIETSQGEGYALGTYARDQFRSRVNLKYSKLHQAVPKILGILWVLQQKLGLPSKFRAVLGCLLPAAECSQGDRAELSELLKANLKSFVTPTGKMKVMLAGNPVVRPEGAGVFLAYKDGFKEQINDLRTGILGVGFRNSNLLISEKGVISPSARHTSSLGFYSLVQTAKEQIGSAVNSEQLASIIGEAGFDVNEMILERFLKSINRANRLQNVIEAIDKAQRMYWYQLLSWFELVGINSFDAVVFYGGTVEYLATKLKEHFDFCQSVIWHSNVAIPQDLIDSIVVEKEQTALSYRFVDCWAFLHYLCAPQPGYQDFGLHKLTINKEEVYA